MMNNSLFAVAMDCADAGALARFWANVLGRQVAEASTSEHAVLLARGGDTCEPCIVFNKVPEAKIAKNRLHLDLISDTFDGESERLLSLGARRLRDRRFPPRRSPPADKEHERGAASAACRAAPHLLMEAKFRHEVMTRTRQPRPTTGCGVPEVCVPGELHWRA